MPKTNKMELKKQFIQKCQEEGKTRPEIADAVADKFKVKITYAYNIVYMVLSDPKYRVSKEQRRGRDSVPTDKRTWTGRYTKKSDDIVLSESKQTKINGGVDIDDDEDDDDLM